MNGAEFSQKIQSDIVASRTLEGGSVDKRTSDRQQKLMELKAKIDSGSYSINLQELAKNIKQSDVFQNE